jgi:hypothetical protein
MRGILLACQSGNMSVSSRKKKNTEIEQRKQKQREKDLKKKQMRDQLPAKHGKK